MLSVQNVYKSFDNTPVLRGINFELAQGEILCLLGASGSGKTTLLRIIAGLEKADSGEILLNDSAITNVPVHQRDFGLMFQDFALFPHMNVAQNVAFGLRMRHLEQQQRTSEVLALVGLTGFENRDVAGLSGGEKQRVALARSLAPQPRLLLLDEPLGSLDAALRERLALELRDIIKHAGLTAIHVTHDQQEAFAIADRIAVMHGGRIEQIDTQRAIYRQPKTVFVAQFLGLNNLVPILGYEAGMAQTALSDFKIEGHPEALLIHPAGIRISASGDFKGTVRKAVFRGEFITLSVEHTSGILLTFNDPSEVNWESGDEIMFDIDLDGVVPMMG